MLEQQPFWIVYMKVKAFSTNSLTKPVKQTSGEFKKEQNINFQNNTQKTKWQLLPLENN